MACEKDWTGFLDKFTRDGYAVIENFLSDVECDELRKLSSELIEDFDFSTHPRSVFSCTDQKNDDYFMSSQDKVRFFLEEDVLDEKGCLNRPKNCAVNKIGHGLHVQNEKYKTATFNQNTKKVANILGYVKPMVVQSMVIFKQPRIGGVVVSHQDGTFLMNNPSKLFGIWIALEDADTENGCLKFIPGSQSRPVTRYMKRTHSKDPPYTKFDNPPDEFDESKFVSAPVKKGSAIVIHGQVVHRSEKNTSDRTREIYTFHIAESHDTHWSEDNWLQPTSTYDFPLLY